MEEKLPPFFPRTTGCNLSISGITKTILMNKKQLKYLKKKKQIINIIVQMYILVESDEYAFHVSPLDHDCDKIAEKILSKMGMNKPTSIK